MVAKKLQMEIGFGLVGGEGPTMMTGNGLLANHGILKKLGTITLMKYFLIVWVWQHLGIGLITIVRMLVPTSVPTHQI